MLSRKVNKQAMNHKTTHRKVYKMWGGAGPEGVVEERKEGEEVEENDKSPESAPSSTPFTMPEGSAEGKPSEPPSDETKQPPPQDETMYTGVKNGIMNSGNNFLSNLTDIVAGPKEPAVVPEASGEPEPQPMVNSQAPPPLDTHNDSIVKDLLEIVKIKEQNSEVQTNLLKELVAVSTKLDILLKQPQSPLSPSDGDDKLPDAEGEEEGDEGESSFKDTVTSPTNGEMESSPALESVSPPASEGAEMDGGPLAGPAPEEASSEMNGGPGPGPGPGPGASSEMNGGPGTGPGPGPGASSEMNGGPGTGPGASSEMNGGPGTGASSEMIGGPGPGASSEMNGGPGPGASSEMDESKRTGGGAKSFRRRQKRNGRRSRKYKYRYVY
jgi:hypothetical protein